MNEDSIAAYDYHLPQELIAQFPAGQRDASRLLALSRKNRGISHRQFVDLPNLLLPGDLLVANETKVLPARLRGIRTATGGLWEGLFLKEEGLGQWRIIGQTRGKLRPGEELTLFSSQPGNDDHTLTLQLLEKQDQGEWITTLRDPRPTMELLDQFGAIPLPHYMQRDAGAADRDRYQTTFARSPGAVAAPTAGLHFTPEVLERCRARGIGFATVTLHVGLGTFRPVSAARLSEHIMHHEWCHLPAQTVAAINTTKAAGGRVIAIGTTTVRTLECVAATGPLQEWSGTTNLFLKPGSTFHVVDVLVTNFHLPKSTLLALVAAFAGREFILSAYQSAIENKYRFYSYGDAMLIE